MIFRRWRPRDEFRPRGVVAHAGDGALRARWMGTACHVFETATTTIVVDPFVTRPGAARMLRPLAPDVEQIARWLPSRVDAVVCGHSHYDHLLDAPVLARRTGARFIGSRTACSFARAAGVAEDRIVEVPESGLTTTVGDVDVRMVHSLHGRIAFGRVPAPGEVRSPPRLPAPIWQYKMGGAFGIHLAPHGGGPTVYHNGSADLVDAELTGLRADVLFVGLAGRRATRDYLGRLVRALAPSVIVPTHHDSFFAPLERGVHLLPFRVIDLDGFFAESRSLAPRATIIAPLYDEPLLVPREDPRAAFLV